MYTRPEDINGDDKKDVLLAILRGYEEHLLNLSASSFKLTITIATGVIVFPILIAEKAPKLPHWSLITLSIVLGLVSVMAIFAIFKFAAHYRWLCRAITRVKQALGLFEEKLYFNRDLLGQTGYDFWFDGDAIMPKESQSWGTKFNFTADIAYTLSITAAYLGSLAILWGKNL